MKLGPTKRARTAESGARVSTALRIRRDIYAWLGEEAARNGRSISEQIEYCLEMSRRDDLLVSRVIVAMGLFRPERAERQPGGYVSDVQHRPRERHLPDECFRHTAVGIREDIPCGSLSTFTITT